MDPSSPLSLLDPLLDLQAGGGGSFGSGGSGGGGGGGFYGGGSGGGGGLIYALIRLVVEVPVVGIPLLVLVVVVTVSGGRRAQRGRQARLIRGEGARVVRRRSQAWGASVREADPDFDEAAFLGRVKQAFERAQRSWCDQDLGAIQHFVTDGVYERFSLQIEEQKEDHWRQGMDGLAVGEPRLVHFARGRRFETITARIEFRADIHRVHLVTGEQLPGSRIPRERFAECWTFVRRRGARSRGEDGLLEGRCPNCGAPLELNQSARCGSCEAFVRSGEFDWVLSEITQASEWRPEDEEDVPGVEAYSGRDPGFSIQLLEDRASVAFWRKVSADRKGSVEPLVRVADEPYCEAFAMELEALAGGDRYYTAENAVGAVRTLGVLPGEERDRAVVEVLSDGRRARVDGEGRHQIETTRRLQRRLFVFHRPAGEATRIDESFSTARCRTCGAHDLGGTDPRCPYCGSPRSGDRATWLLHEVVVDHTADARELRAELAAQAGARPTAEAPAGPGRALARVSSADLVTWAASLVQVDGRLDPRERAALTGLAERAEVSPARLDELRDGEGVDGSTVPVPRDTFEAREWLRALLELALVDGSISGAEQRFLRRAAEALGVGRAELDRLLGRVRSELAGEARAARS
jgi:tellurite resistance protein